MHVKVYFLESEQFEEDQEREAKRIIQTKLRRVPLEDLIRVSKVSNEKYKIDLTTNSSHMTYNLFFCLSLYINSVIHDHDY